MLILALSAAGAQETYDFRPCGGGGKLGTHPDRPDSSGSGRSLLFTEASPQVRMGCAPGQEEGAPLVTCKLLKA